MGGVFGPPSQFASGVKLSVREVGLGLSTQATRVSVNRPPWVNRRPWLRVLDSQVRTHLPASRCPFDGSCMNWERRLITDTDRSGRVLMASQFKPPTSRWQGITTSGLLSDGTWSLATESMVRPDGYGLRMALQSMRSKSSSIDSILAVWVIETVSWSSSVRFQS
jgi:hypothetical protein